MISRSLINTRVMLSYGGLLMATCIIFAIAEYIRAMLLSYELTAMFISFVVGFILFIPLVSLVLHPLVTVRAQQGQAKNSSVFANAGIALVVQILFFLIWITDAISLYSLYVDQTSFLAKVFNISGDKLSNMGEEFYWLNLFLAWLFALLSILIGLFPCLIARIDNRGVVASFIASFGYAKKHKALFSAFALLVALAVIVPLLYAKYLFLLSFPLMVSFLLRQLTRFYRAANLAG